MIDYSNTTVLIPASGPSETLGILVHGLHTRGCTIVVPCDGGEAACDAVFHLTGESAQVIPLPQNAGRAEMIRAGIAHVREQHARHVVVTADANGVYGVEDILRVARIAQENTGKLILGARIYERVRIPAFLLHVAYRFFAKLDVRDLTTRLRAFDEALSGLLMDVPGEPDEYEMNVLLRCAKENVPILETKIDAKYPDGGAGNLFSAFRHYLRVYGNMIKFSLSSFAGFVTDYAMFNLLYFLASGMGDFRIDFANYTARVISATINYTINRRLVFKSNENVVKTAVQYYALATLILIGNTYILSFLIENVRMNAQIAKLLTEILFFLMSWVVQRFIIFRKKARETARG